MATILIQNIGRIFTGDIDRPLAEGDSILIEDGVIREVGADLPPAADQIYDAKGSAVLPGLVDCHVHVAISEWTPRQSALAWLEAYGAAGITGVISAGESHVPGRPRDAAGVMGLAVLTQRIFEKLRPGGVKVYAGALIPEKGLTEEDFRRLAELGLTHTGEIGLGGAVSAEDAGEMAKWGRKYGIKTMCHTGATFLEGTTLMDTERILSIRPDVICHLSGGGIPEEGMRRFLDETDAQVEICAVNRPNPRLSGALVEMLKERRALRRLMLGTDSPSGYGIFPQGVWEVIGMLTGVLGLAPEIAIACGSGNTSRFYGIRSNMLRPGYAADLMICDAPLGSAYPDAAACLADGVIPGVSLVMVDGAAIASGPAVNTAPPKRQAEKIR